MKVKVKKMTVFLISCACWEGRAMYPRNQLRTSMVISEIVIKKSMYGRGYM